MRGQIPSLSVPRGGNHSGGTALAALPPEGEPRGAGCEEPERAFFRRGRRTCLAGPLIGSPGSAQA